MGLTHSRDGMYVAHSDAVNALILRPERCDGLVSAADVAALGQQNVRRVARRLRKRPEELVLHLDSYSAFS
jgi:hypothetical protein